MFLSSFTLLALADPIRGQCAGTRLVTMEYGSGSLARDGDTLLVGDPVSYRPLPAPDPPVRTGSVHVLQRDRRGTPDPSDDAWVEVARLFPDVEVDLYRFGWCVALSGGSALIGNRPTTPGAQSGTVHAFERHDNGTPADPFDDTWIEIQTLEGTLAPRADKFGTAITMAGTTALIGAMFDGTMFEGAAYVYERADNGTPDPFDDSWIRVEKLLPGPTGAFGMQFGCAVALAGNTALVGAMMAETPVQSGSVFLFGRDDAGTPADPFDDHWLSMGELEADVGYRDELGSSLALDGDLLLVGAPQEPVSSPPNGGKVCVFHHGDAGTPADPFDDVWTELLQFSPAGATTGDAFGHSLSLDGDRLLVGANKDDDPLYRVGRAYLFERLDGGTPADPLDDTWVELEQYRPVDFEEEDEHGRSVVLLGDEVLVGSERGAHSFRAGEPCSAFVGQRPGLGLNVNLLTSVTLPALGGEWRLEIDNTVHAHPVYSLLLGTDRPLTPGIWTFLGELLVDPTGSLMLSSQTLSNPAGTDIFVYAVPADAALLGLQLFVQGAVLGGGGFLSPALNVVCGLAPPL